jgi:hypothetical protein
VNQPRWQTPGVFDWRFWANTYQLEGSRYAQTPPTNNNTINQQKQIHPNSQTPTTSISKTHNSIFSPDIHTSQKKSNSAFELTSTGGAADTGDANDLTVADDAVLLHRSVHTHRLAPDSHYHTNITR